MNTVMTKQLFYPTDTDTKCPVVFQIECVSIKFVLWSSKGATVVHLGTSGNEKENAKLTFSINIFPIWEMGAQA